MCPRPPLTAARWRGGRSRWCPTRPPAASAGRGLGSPWLAAARWKPHPGWAAGGEKEGRKGRVRATCDGALQTRWSFQEAIRLRTPTRRCSTAAAAAHVLELDDRDVVQRAVKRHVRIVLRDLGG